MGSRVLVSNLIVLSILIAFVPRSPFPTPHQKYSLKLKSFYYNLLNTEEKTMLLTELGAPIEDLEKKINDTWRRL